VVPTISRFYGIVITMFFNDHPPPHVHVRYGEHVGRIDYRTGDVLTGDTWSGHPTRRRMVGAALRRAGCQLGQCPREAPAEPDRPAAMTIAPRMLSAVAVGSFVVRVLFADGEVRDVDLSRYLDGPVFGPLRDPALFARVTVDEETRTVTWPNGADLDPDVIYTPSLSADDAVRITVPSRAA